MSDQKQLQCGDGGGGSNDCPVEPPPSSQPMEHISAKTGPIFGQGGGGVGVFLFFGAGRRRDGSMGASG